jgi:hypothetical protein
VAADFSGNERLLRGVFGYQPLRRGPATPAATAAPGAPGAPAVAPTGLSIKAQRGG